MRIYEEQESDGVAYEWALLAHLAAAGLPVPARVEGPPPGACRVGGKPVALFELVGGTPSCQRGVTPARAAAVGELLALSHRAAAGFDRRRAGRFRLADVRDRIAQAARAGRPELEAPLGRLRAVLDEIETALPPDLPVGVIHGDLFRDNVRFEGDRIVAVIDWESASDGLLGFDLMVALLAWSFGESLDWSLARALVSGYERVRPLPPGERAALRLLGLAAAARFSATRITDYHLRSGIGERVIKDYRRFLARLEALHALDADEVARRLTG